MSALSAAPRLLRSAARCCLGLRARCAPVRALSDGPAQGGGPEADAKRRRMLGVLSGALTVTVFAGFYVWKEAKLRSLEEQAKLGRVGPETSIGAAQQGSQQLSVGGDFRLQDHTGRYVTRQELSAASGSGWLLMYFGFCHCPDVCPEQMEKMVEVVERLRLARQPRLLSPVFVSIDPERDTPRLVREYVRDFSDSFVGLTGTKAEVEDVAKRFRVYYSKGPVDQDGDYIVDHAIIMYLVSPDGRVVDYYGQTKTAKEVAQCVATVMQSYRPA